MQCHSSLLLLILLTYAICISSAFHGNHVIVPTTLFRHQLIQDSKSRCTTASYTTELHMSYKSPDEANSYNDDAFGLLFVVGGYNDVDFGATFLVVSAIAAIGTNTKYLQKDERLPAGVAMLTLLASPIVSSLRETGSLDSIVPPSSLELGLCVVSSLWALISWALTLYR